MFLRGVKAKAGDEDSKQSRGGEGCACKPTIVNDAGLSKTKQKVENRTHSTGPSTFCICKFMIKSAHVISSAASHNIAANCGSVLMRQNISTVVHAGSWGGDATFFNARFRNFLSETNPGILEFFVATV
jgi:hypothetical protein